MSPSWNPDQKGVKVQIVDVFSLELATGYDKDPTGRLLLSSEPSVSAGRTWSLAKACQLVRNDKRPHRWVVLHRHKKAWGLFWAGGVGGPASGAGVLPGAGLGAAGVGVQAQPVANPGGLGGPASGAGVRPGLGIGAPGAGMYRR